MAGTSAFGTLLYSGSFAGLTAGSNNLLYAQVTNIERSGAKVDMVDTTAHDSSGGYKEMAPTFINPGEVKLDLNWNPNLSGHASGSISGSAGTLGLEYLMVNKTKQLFTIYVPAATTAYKQSFSAYVSDFSWKAPYDGVLTASATLTISGAVTSGSA